jgi:ABC-type glycerol-3-phosphate transport system substrate-binding protein
LRGKKGYVSRNTFRRKVFMRKTNARRICALMLSLLMAAGSVPAVFAADSSDDSSGESGTTLATLSGSLVQTTYQEYLDEYAPEEVSDTGVVLKSQEEVIAEKRVDAEVVIDALDYDADGTDAEVSEVEDSTDGTTALRSDGVGTVTWNFTVPETGFYNIDIIYRSVNDNTVDIERVMYINGRVPFTEARHLYLKKIWAFNYNSDTREGVFDVDGNGNELRPGAYTVSDWQTYSVKDANAYTLDPFEFYLEAGENSISLEGIREEVDIKEIIIRGYEETPSYEDVLQSYADAGYTAAEAETIHLDAEMPSAVSDYTIYPVYDRTSAITEPQDSVKLIRNTIGSDKWTSASQWVEYTFEITEPGLYNIMTRFKQSELRGVPVSRITYIDGEIPFEEAKYTSFAYSSSWQMSALTDGYSDFEFYFEPGEHTVRFEVNLGIMTESVSRVNAVVTALNNDYKEIIKLVGQTADADRDYGFGRVMPDVIADFSTESYELKAIVEYITTIGGGRSDNISTLEQLANLLEKMGSDEDEIASNLDNLLTQISSLGTWIDTMTTQTLELDYIEICPAGTEVAKSKIEANGWQAFMFEMKKFAGSFFADYNSMGYDTTEDSTVITAWTSSGRDQAQIMKNLIADGFTRDTGISVELKLVASSTLLPSILAGVGPDVSLDNTSPVEMAIRGAIIPLNDFEGFDEVTSWFAESTLVPVSLYGETYAIPTAITATVMFYREDILEDLGIDVPETWDDLMAAIPVLQFNNMNIGIAPNPNVYMFQNGDEAFWADDGMCVGWDTKEYLEPFETLANYFTQYSLPYTYSATTRLKTGDMPIVIAEYLSTYNTLVVYAPEIAGLWDFCELPGTTRVDEDGNTYVDHTTQAYVTGIIMPKGCTDQESAWEFMKWYAGKDYQVDYSNEMMAILGPSAKQGVANLEALAELPWTASEYQILYSMISNSKTIAAYPGSYFTDRYIGFALVAAYSDGDDPSEAVLSYVDETNAEITRKRKEFHLMVEDEWKAIKEYMGFETVDEWKEYAEENGIAYNKYSDDTYDFLDWMTEKGITTDKYDSWSSDVYSGKTSVTFKEYIDG